MNNMYLMVEEKQCNGMYRNDGFLQKFCTFQEEVLACEYLCDETKMCMYNFGDTKPLIRLEVEEQVILGDVPRLEDKLIIIKQKNGEN